MSAVQSHCFDRGIRAFYLPSAPPLYISWAPHPRGVLQSRKKGSRKTRGHGTATSSSASEQSPLLGIPNDLLLPQNALPGSPAPPLLVPGVSMLLFIYSVTFSVGAILPSALTLAMLTVEEGEFNFWEHPQHSGVSPVAWRSWKSPHPPHITDTACLGKSVTPLSLGASTKQVGISDTLLILCWLNSSPCCFPFLLPTKEKPPHNKWVVRLTWTMGVWSGC